MYATLTPCEYPLCPNNAAAAGCFCEQHRQPAAHGAPRQLYAPHTRNDNRLFRRLRSAFLSRHPICAVCQRAAAGVLDHIVPHRGDANLFWDQNNWQSLCLTCHNRKTARGL